jgi:biopolymer transport protein ExbD
MSFIPEDVLRSKESIPLAPMIDFVFIMLLFFASLAITRTSLKDTQIDLVTASYESAPEISASDKEHHSIQISILADGTYKWIGNNQDFSLGSLEDLNRILTQQTSDQVHQVKPQVLLKIDKNARWDPILKAIFTIRDAGYVVRPVYEEKG